ncbi:MAG: hypothetical protein JNM99_14820 [Verrucomicrobiaceae bacterium]|nr:hypothetical protein [Verrucomicrobiaceae bacterium]
MNNVTVPLHRAVVYLRHAAPQFITRSELLEQGFKVDNDHEFVIAVRLRLEAYHEVKEMNAHANGVLHVFVVHKPEVITRLTF